MYLIYSNTVEGDLYIGSYFCSCYLHRVMDVNISKFFALSNSFLLSFRFFRLVNNIDDVCIMHDCSKF